MKLSLETELTPEQLLWKSEGVKDCVKWLRTEIQLTKTQLEKAKQDLRDFGWFEDCASSYEKTVIEVEAKLENLIATKISLEKYAKKLKHQSMES